VGARRRITGHWFNTRMLTPVLAGGPLVPNRPVSLARAPKPLGVVASRLVVVAANGSAGAPDDTLLELAQRARQLGVAEANGGLAHERLTAAGPGAPTLRAEHYDAEAAAAYFAGRPWDTTRRFLQVGAAAVRVAVRVGCLRVGSWRATDEDQAGAAKALTTELGRLGPSFIKLAQTASTRRDLLGDVICDALAGTSQPSCNFRTM
jgi:hypothetical protein